MRKMSTKTTTTALEASVEDIQRVQGIGDNNRGVIRSTTGTVYWQQQRSLYFLCYRISNSNTVSSLSCCCLVLVLIFSYSFFFVHCKKYFQNCNCPKISLYQVYTNLAYVSISCMRVKK